MAVTDLLGGPVPVKDALRGAGYLADDDIADALLLADGLGKPLLIEGPAGVGKTELAKAAAAITGSRLLRLQCYEGIDEAKALYEWNYKKQLLRIQAGDEESWDETEANIFTQDFLLERPLLAAIRATDPVVLLIDEVDRVEVETEALLLEVLSDFQVSIPELGTLTAQRQPLVFLTSNATRELSDALKRRCLYLHLDYPGPDRERDIIRLRVPGLDAALAGQAARIVHALRSLELDKPPSISESVDWARSLVLLGVTSLDGAVISRTLPVLLKNKRDIERARAELELSSSAQLTPGQPKLAHPKKEAQQMSTDQRSTTVAGMPAGQEAREQELADRVLASFAHAGDARLEEVMQALTRHLHGFLREVRLTEDEWRHAITFLTEAGHITDDKRQEFVLMSDVLGASMQMITINNEAYANATEATVVGPFFVEGSPQIPPGGDIAAGAAGEPCWVEGTVTDTDGKTVPGARIEVWEADDDGFYDVQYPDDRTAARAHLSCTSWSARTASAPW